MGVELMSNSVILRIPIVLAWGTPSLALWLVLRFAAKRSSISMDRMRDWLIVGCAALLGLYVVFTAAEKDIAAGFCGMNLCGFQAVLCWLTRRSKQYERTTLNLSGREVLTFHPLDKAR